MNPIQINPEGWPQPKGYSNGMIGEGRILVIGGQIGWTAHQVFERTDFLGQFDQTLANTRAILDAAGATPEQVIRMTVYVTDLEAYRNSLHALGPIWRTHMGRSYPTMALVGVAGLVEKDALIEIETTAILPSETTA
jgi:enamine deaminase RidA (YjgF/YER057c/UK114 family)